MSKEVFFAAYQNGKEQDVLVIWTPKSDKWLEVRGKLDISEDDLLQSVIDKFPGSLVGGELMAGNIASITDRMYKDALPILKKLWDE